jgi:hypothetical protein
VFDGKMAWSDVSKMNIDDLHEASAGLDIYIDKINKSQKKGG